MHIKTWFRVCRCNSLKPLKAIVTVILAAAFLWKVNEALVKYSLQDTLMVIKTLNPEKQTFPSVTICKGNVSMGNFTEIPEEIGGLETWAICKFDHKKQSVDVHDQKSPWTFRTAAQYLGHTSCHTFTPPHKVVPSISHRLDLTINTNVSDFIFLTLHDEKQNIPHAMETLDSSMHVFHFPYQHSQIHFINLAVTTERVKRLNTNKAPCETDPHKEASGMFDCLEDYFQNRIGKCSLPWRVNKNQFNSYAECGQSAYQKYYSYIMELLEAPTYEIFYNATGCVRSCENYVYSYTIPMDYYWESKKDMIILSISLKPKGIIVKKEVLVFDTLDMVGNIGGYLGLLLGWSALSAYNVVLRKVSMMFGKSKNSVLLTI